VTLKDPSMQQQFQDAIVEFIKWWMRKCFPESMTDVSDSKADAIVRDLNELQEFED